MKYIVFFNKIYSHLSGYLLGCFTFCAFNFWILVYSPLYSSLTIHTLLEMAVSRLEVILKGSFLRAYLRYSLYLEEIWRNIKETC